MTGLRLFRFGCARNRTLKAWLAVRHFFKRWIDQILPIFPALSASFIIFICSLVIALNQERLEAMTLPILAAAVVLNIYGMSMGCTVGKVFRMGLTRRRTLAIEIGMQNAGLGSCWP